MGRTYRRRPEDGFLKIRYTSESEEVNRGVYVADKSLDWLTRKKKTQKKQTDKGNTKNDKPEGKRPNRLLIICLPNS